MVADRNFVICGYGHSPARISGTVGTPSETCSSPSSDEMSLLLSTSVIETFLLVFDTSPFILPVHQGENVFESVVGPTAERVAGAERLRFRPVLSSSESGNLILSNLLQSMILLCVPPEARHLPSGEKASDTEYVLSVESTLNPSR